MLDCGVGSALGVVSVLLVAWMVRRPARVLAVPRRGVRGQPLEDRPRRRRRHARLRAQPVLLAAQLPRPERVPAGVRRSALDAHRRRPAAGHCAAADSPARCRAAQPSMLKIYGEAPSCSRGIEGTGFVYAPHRVMTNAHVVAGSDPVQVQQRRPVAAAPTSCCSTPSRDVAVLDVPDLRRGPAALRARTARKTGDPAVVLGYPENGPLRRPGRRGCGRARPVSAHDIYGNGGVEREIYSIRVARAQRQLRRPAAGDRRHGARHGVRDGAATRRTPATC